MGGAGLAQAALQLGFRALIAANPAPEWLESVASCPEPPCFRHCICILAADDNLHA